MSTALATPLSAVPRRMGTVATVISIVPAKIEADFPGLFPGHIVIPASSDGMEDVQAIHLKEFFHFVYQLEGKSLKIEDPADKVAYSVCMDYISSQGEIGPGCLPGITYLQTEITAREFKEKHRGLLTELQINQKRWFEKMVRVADNDFARSHQHNHVPDFTRRIAEILKLNKDQHPWMNLAAEMIQVKCVACRSMIEPDAAICPICRTDQASFVGKK